MIGRISRGKIYTEISKNYNIVHSYQNKKESYIETVCKLMQEGYTNSEIYDKLDIPGDRCRIMEWLSSVRRRRIFKEVSDKYKW